MKLEESEIFKELGDPSFIALGSLDGIFLDNLKQRGILRYNIGLLHRHLERVDAILEFSESSYVMLDVGCGYGDILLELAKEGKMVVGIDLNPNCLTVSNARFKKHGLRGNFVRCDAQGLPFRDKVFDGAYCNQVIEHVPSPVKMAKEMFRVSRKEIILIHFNYRSLLRYLWSIFLLKRPERITQNIKFQKQVYKNYTLPINSRLIVDVSSKLGKFLCKIPIIRVALSANVINVTKMKT